MESKIVIKLKIKGQWIYLTKEEFLQLKAEIEEISGVKTNIKSNL